MLTVMQINICDPNVYVWNPGEIIPFTIPGIGGMKVPEGRIGFMIRKENGVAVGFADRSKIVCFEV